ncbi:MAG TPA: hypothetical protein EYG73_14150 [Arcobacter sp.]|nr:hypothetical protein [Arcobacter sp.]
MKIKYVIYPLLAIVLFDDLIYLYTNIRVFGKIASIALLLFILFHFISKKYFSISIIKAGSIFIIFIFFNLLMHIIFNIDSFSIVSFIYETYKLGIFFSLFILILLNKSDSISIIHFVLKLLSIFIVLNFIVLVFQHLFGADVIKYIGINSSAMDFQTSRNRPSGLTTGANIIGVASLFIFIILNYFLIEKEKFEFSLKQLKNIEFIRYITVFTIVLSTSKNALLLLLLYPLFIGKIKKKYFIVIILMLITTVYTVYSYNIYGINDKLLMYEYVINNYDSFDSKLIEHRALSILEGFSMFVNNFPLGSGFGTWGDYSSSLNNNIDDVNCMSDSYFIHLLVEQGVFVILYFTLLFLLLRKHVLGIYMFISLFIVFIPTMGFGSSTFPYIFSFFIFLMHFKNKNHSLKISK